MEALVELKYKDPVLFASMTFDPSIFTINKSYEVALVKAIISQRIRIRVARKLNKELGHDFTIRSLKTRDLSFLPPRKKSIIENVIKYVEENDIVVSADTIPIFSKIKGIGKWTIQMALLSHPLENMDIFPDGDVYLKNLIRKIYGCVEVLEVTNKWKPYRSLATTILLKGFKK
jgi:3-methyladenine DNA glycosylase/8-oxoguanine DNA glycosylase